MNRLQNGGITLPGAPTGVVASLVRVAIRIDEPGTTIEFDC
jgi:hypothetical protein